MNQGNDSSKARGIDAGPIRTFLGAKAKTAAPDDVVESFEEIDNREKEVAAAQKEAVKNEAKRSQA